MYKHVTHTDSAISDLYVKFKGKVEDDTFLTNFSGKQLSTLNPLMSKMAKGASTASQITTYMAVQLDSSIVLMSSVSSLSGIMHSLFDGIGVAQLSLRPFFINEIQC